jgi:hypothetical protein
MLPELGQFALILALLLSLVQCVLPLVGAQTGNRALMAVARPAVAGQAVFVALAFALLALLRISPPGDARWFSAGVFAGLAALFRQDLGIYALLALAVSVALVRPDAHARARRCPRSAGSSRPRCSRTSRTRGSSCPSWRHRPRQGPRGRSGPPAVR